jgi:hypothetical protein
MQVHVLFANMSSIYADAANCSLYEYIHDIL